MTTVKESYYSLTIVKLLTKTIWKPFFGTPWTLSAHAQNLSKHPCHLGPSSPSGKAQEK